MLKNHKLLHRAKPSSQAFRKLGEAFSNILASKSFSSGSAWRPKSSESCGQKSGQRS